jgi:spermidine/putrescine transport system permease protein
VPAVGSFMEPRILGGAKVAVLGTAVEEQFTVTANWPFGGALSFMMLGAVLLICLALYPFARKRMEGL